MDTIRLMAVGDIMLGEHPLCLGHGVGSVAKEKGSRFIFDKIAPILNKADIVFGNLENMLLDYEDKTGKFERRYLRARAEGIEGLRHAGFNILNLANNHALQHGEAALKGTIELLDRRGIKYVGVRGCNSAVFDFGFTKIGFLGYCSDQQYEKANIFVEPIDLAGLSRDVQELKRSGINFIVVSLHWGGEFVHRPSPSQIDLGRSIIEMGANLVLGHHSHVIQGIETYKGGTIVYSLGNFISDMRWNRHLERTMIALCEISALGDITVKPIPVRLNRFFQPEPATGREGEEISSRVDILSRELNRFDLKRPLYTESGYRSEVKRRKNINRLGMYRHFISHLHKYGRGTPHEILRFFLWKKIDKVIWAGKRLFAKSKTIP